MKCRFLQAVCLLVGCSLSAATGCQTLSPHFASNPHHVPPPITPHMPRELQMVALPTYVIEPPDILSIEAIHIVPRAPYELRTGDILSIQAQGTLPDAPIAGTYPVEPGGLVNLGLPYGAVKVAGMTTEQAHAEITRQLEQLLREPHVSVSLLQISGLQQIAGEHLVGPDGTVTLGSYGSVSVVGLTLEQAKFTIEQFLSQYLEDPVIAVDVFAYNSKVYYVVMQGAGLGDSVVRFPITGKETVLDAIANVNGLTSLSSKRIWIARPTHDMSEVQVLPVDWNAITASGAPTTNYQLMPNDRVFIAEDQWVAFDTRIGKLTAPFERLMGFALLGQGTAARYSGKVLQNGRNLGGGGFGF